MFVVNILGFASLGCLLSIHYREKINTVAQTALGIWMLLLYVLAFFQKLSWIDGISVAFILTLIFYLRKKHLPAKDTVKSLADGPAVLFVMTVAIISFLVRNKLVTDLDEFGVWGPEPKCLYMLDGFADKYMNLLSGYSAYHPGAMLIEWWTCHLAPNQFHEGLLYVGVWLIILCSVAPVFEKLPINRRAAVLLSLPVSGLLILLPSMYGSTNYLLIAEMPMSMVFAGCLLSCFDRETHDEQFQFLRYTVNLAFLMMLKETGVIFAVFVLLFYILLDSAQNKEKPGTRKIAFAAKGFALALIPMLIWRIYCVFYERSNYFSVAFDDTVSDIQSHTFALSADLPGYVTSMLKAWWGQPLHIVITCGLDLTPLAAALLVLALCWYCAGIRVIEKSEAVRFSVLYAGFLFVYMGMLLFMHAYIFNEPGYLKQETMIFSIGRYAEPLFLGIFVYFVALILREARDRKLQLKRGVAIAVGLFLCARVNLAKESIVNYKGMNDQIGEVRTSVMEQEPVAAFVEEANRYFTENDQARILWISDQENVLAQNNTERILWHLFAPRTYAYYQVNAEGLTAAELEETIQEQVEKLHFGYVYFDFSEPVDWQLPGTQLIQNRTLYRITLQEEDSLCLESMRNDG